MLQSIDHFTVVCLVTWPLGGSKARVDLVLIQTSFLLMYKTICSDVNKVHLHDKSREVCVKTRSTLASLPSKGQVTTQRTVLTPIKTRQVFFAGHIPQVTITGHSIFARKQHKNSLNSANRTRLALKYIFSKNIFHLGAQF